MERLGCEGFGEPERVESLDGGTGRRNRYASSRPLSVCLVGYEMWSSRGVLAWMVGMISGLQDCLKVDSFAS